MGADFERRRTVFDENLEILRQALSGEDVTAEGAGYSARGVRVQPPAVQRPHPPLWIHGNARFGIERAARFGAGWVGLMMGQQRVATLRTAPLPDLDAFAKRISALSEAVSRAGRSMDEIELVATGVLPMVDSRIGWQRDEVAERVGRLTELGVGTIIVNACGDDPVASEESALQFAADFLG